MTGEPLHTNWADRRSPWARGMRRRVIGAALLFLTMLGLAVGLVWFTLTAGPFWSLLWFWLVMVGLLWLTAEQLRQDLRLARLIPTRDGFICTTCRAELPIAETGACPGCALPYERATLWAHWAQYALAPTSVSAEQDTKPTRWKWKSRIGLGLVLLAIFVAYAWLTQRSWVGALVSFGPYLVFGLCWGQVIPLFAYLSHARRGDTPRCVQCDYQQPPEGALSERCPECGAAWTEPGGTVRGVRIAFPWKSIVALSVVLVWSAGIFLPLWWGISFAPLLRMVPTATLVHDAANQAGSTQEVWTELDQRTLTATQEHALAEGLLDRRVRRCYLNAREGAWLFRAIQSGRLPASLLDRYLNETLALRIEAPDQVRVGQPFEIGIGATYCRANPPTAIDEYICVRGFSIGVPPSEIDCRTQPTYAGLLNDPRYRIAVQHVAEQPGPLRIRLQAALFVGPLVGDVQWYPDGSPVVPAGMVGVVPFDLSRTIEVLE